MLNARFASFMTVAVVLLASMASAHHNMSAVYDFNRTVTRTGTLTRLDWRNPHIGLFVDAPGDDGELETWAFEGPAASYFRTRDSNKSSFEAAVGKLVTIEASRARDDSRSGLIRVLTMPDGETISLCPQNC